ncbi:hypothetical protein [Streptodolium elevatio]
MTTPARSWRIDTVLGPHGAAEAVHALAATYRRHDLLDEGAAFRAACELAATGTAWLLARPSQVWELGDGLVPTAETPHRIRITKVLPACAARPMRVRFIDLARRRVPWRKAGHLRVDDLDACYALTAWPNPPTRKEATP